MGHDESNQGTSTMIPVILGVLVLAGLGGLAIVGLGAVFFVRNTALRREAQVQQLRAQEAELRAMTQQRARELPSRESLTVRVTPPASPQEVLIGPSGGSANSSVTILMDADGTIQLDDHALPLAELETRLRSGGEAPGSSPPSITMLVDKRCRFEHVSQVLSLCERLGRVNVRLRAWERALEAETP